MADNGDKVRVAQQTARAEPIAAAKGRAVERVEGEKVEIFVSLPLSLSLVLSFSFSPSTRRSVCPPTHTTHTHACTLACLASQLRPPKNPLASPWLPSIYRPWSGFPFGRRPAHARAGR